MTCGVENPKLPGVFCERPVGHEAMKHKDVLGEGRHGAVTGGDWLWWKGGVKKSDIKDLFE